MALVMTKYTFNDKNYLVYEQNMFMKDFSNKAFATIADNDFGVGVDYIIVIKDEETYFYNSCGVQTFETMDMKNVLDYYFDKNLAKNTNITNTVEVRFTDFYINEVYKNYSVKKRAYIA